MCYINKWAKKLFAIKNYQSPTYKTSTKLAVRNLFVSMQVNKNDLLTNNYLEI